MHTIVLLLDSEQQAIPANVYFVIWEVQFCQHCVCVIQDGKTALMYASGTGQKEAVNTLLSAKADVDRQNDVSSDHSVSLGIVLGELKCIWLTIYPMS